MARFSSYYRATTERIAGLKAMDLLVRHINYEDVIGSWLMDGVPDGATDDDYLSIAVDDIEFDHVCNLFLRIMGDEDTQGGGLFFDGGDCE